MDNCYSCGVPFDGTNNSQEHIINDSIGGRWKSRGLLCISCNNMFGSGIDQVLKDQLGVFADHLGIIRQREKKNIAVPVKGPDGEIKMLGKSLKPHAKLTTTLPDGKKIVEYVPDEQFEAFVEKKKAEVSRKYTVVTERYYEEQPIAEKHTIQNSLSGKDFDIGFGGDDYFRSIIKMVVNLYIKRGHEIDWARPAISVIRKKADNDMAYFYYVPLVHHEVHKLADDEITHILHIRGDVKKRILYAYVELFNMQNVLICLNMEYDGTEINDTYAYNLITGEELNKEIDIKLGRYHFQILQYISRSNRNQMDVRYRRLEKIIEKMQLNS